MYLPSSLEDKWAAQHKDIRADVDTSHSFRTPGRRWQREDDPSQMEHRKLTLLALAQFFCQRNPNASEAWRICMLKSTKMLELELFRSAESLEEYADDSTLIQRMKAVTRKLRQRQSKSAAAARQQRASSP